MKQLNQDLNLWELADAVGLLPTDDSWIQYGDFDAETGRTEEIEMPLMRNESGNLKFAVNPETHQTHQLRVVSGRGNDKIVMADGYRPSGYETRSSLSGKFHPIRPGSLVKVPDGGKWKLGTIIDNAITEGKVKVELDDGRIKTVETPVVHRFNPNRPEAIKKWLLERQNSMELPLGVLDRDMKLYDELESESDPIERDRICSEIEYIINGYPSRGA